MKHLVVEEEKSQTLVLKKFIGVLILLGIVLPFFLADFVGLKLDSIYYPFTQAFGSFVLSPTRFHILRLFWSVILMVCLPCMTLSNMFGPLLSCGV